MNKLLSFIILSVAFLFMFTGCKKEDAGGEKPDNNNSGAQGYLPVKNAKLTYKITKGEEEGFTYTEMVNNFRDSSGYRVATISIEAPGIEKQTYRGFYNSERTITQNTIPAIYYEMLETIKEQYTTSFTHKEEPLITNLPHKSQAGEKVAPETIVATWHGVQVNEDDRMEADFELKHGETKVTGNEKITTAAGSFDCVKLERVVSVKTTFTLNGAELSNSKVETTLTTWLAKGVGVVKSSEVDKTGKTTVTELIKIE